jgi:hypothetical protein
LQALDKSPAAQPQVGTEGAEAGEDRKAAGPAAAARTPAPGSAAPAPGPPGTTTSADPTESRHAPAMPQGHGGARV